MTTLLMTPELFQTEGGISRILRLYLKALDELSAPGDQLGYVALNDDHVPLARVAAWADRPLYVQSGYSRKKLRFAAACLWQGIRADRVVCGHLHQLPVAWLLGWFRPGIKYYLVAHGIEVWRPYSLLERAALRGAHRILCVSEYTRRQMLRFAPFLDPARLLVVPNTFDPSFAEAEVTGYKLGAGSQESEVRSQESKVGRPSPDDRCTTPDPRSPSEAGSSSPAAVVPFPRILVVSRLAAADPYKGVDLMIEAMPRVLRNHPRAQLRVVGGGDDVARLQELAAPVGEAVQFTGLIGDDALRAEYAACDLFALPSRKEGFGLVYLEAMSYGKPCLAARAGGAPEVVNDDVGAVVEYGNTDQIATAVTDLLRHPRDPAAIRQRARQFSFAEFRQRLAKVFHG